MEGALGSRDPPGKEASELCVPQHLPEGSGPRRACELASEHRRWEHPWDAPLAPLLTGWGPSELNTCCTCHLVVFRMICRKRCQRSKAAAHSAEQQSLCSVRPESAKAGAIPACQSLVGSSDTPGVAVDSTQGACDSVAHRHTAAYSVSDSWRSGQSTPKGPTVSDTFLEANHPPKLHELCPCSAARP